MLFDILQPTGESFQGICRWIDVYDENGQIGLEDNPMFCTEEMELTEDQRHWASRRKQGVAPSDLRDLLKRQEGRCALSGVRLEFDVAERTPVKGGRGCHPLSPAVDHIDPGNPRGGYQIICYALNDLKGHLPQDCFEALVRTEPWQALMAQWRDQADRDRSNRDTFMRLLRPNAEDRRGSAIEFSDCDEISSVE
jgi:hypothetical protein